MLLRPYQNRLVKKAKANLKKNRNTLAIAATGAGKTIMLAALAKEMGGKTLILQHRQELVEQNLKKFRLVNPDWRVSIFDAQTKSMAGDAVFGMQQTLCRNLDCLPQFDHVITDECHHLPSPTYTAIIEALKAKNKKLLLTGFTATPERSDKKSLRRFFNNVADQITIRELVGLGFLVPPRAFVVDLGVQSRLEKLQNLSAFGDQSDVAEVLDTRPINEEVVKHWKEKAGDRQTIVFCSTVKHAADVADAFRSNGVACGVVSGDMPAGERKKILADFDAGRIQVITNVAVLTEGYDSQPVSCVILLRLCSDKGPLIQMAGRGLRVVDPELHYGVVKKDCILLDFGTSILKHGNLDMEDGLHEEREKQDKGEAITKTCPAEYQAGTPYRYPDSNGSIGCGIDVPAQTRICPVCGFRFERLDGQEPLQEVDLMEMDILSASPFRWCSLFESDMALVATGFDSWGGIFSPDHGDTWVALGGKKGEQIHKLAITSRPLAMAAADDWMRATADVSAVRKSKRWLDEPATGKQLAILNRFGYDVHADFMGNSQYSKYTAAAHSTFCFNRAAIEKALGVV